MKDWKSGIFGADEPHATLHDASFESIHLDYRTGEARIGCLLDVGAPDAPDDAARARERRGTLVFTGLQYLVIEPPGVGGSQTGGSGA